MITAEELFDPNFISLYSDWGIVRFMQWMGAVDNEQALWSSRPQPTGPSWIGENLHYNNYTGLAPTNTNNQYVGTKAPVGNPSAWTQGMEIEMSWSNAPTTFSVSAFAPKGDGIHSTLTATGHTFSNGDTVTF